MVHAEDVDQKDKLEALHKQGNEAVAKGAYREALGIYAAALATIGNPSKSDEITKKAATLRSNRALCCLKLKPPLPELALAEAEKSEELRPDWAKAHFRKAAALEALGHIGEARLALCYARRLAPMDRDIGDALIGVRRKLCGNNPLSDSGRIVVALDTLEEYEQEPEDTKAAAKELKDLLLAECGQSSDEQNRENLLRIFVAGKGADTIFRRQNAMGTHWREECSNGTMSLLSELVSMVPRLEQELVALNHAAEVRELGNLCKDGQPGCREPPQRGPLPPPKAPARARQRGSQRRAKPIGEACAGIVPVDPEMSEYIGEMTELACPESVPTQPVCQSSNSAAPTALTATSAAVPVWRALILAFLHPREAFQQIAACAAMNRAWSKSAEILREDPAFSCSWSAWTELKWAGLVSTCFGRFSAEILRRVFSLDSSPKASLTSEGCEGDSLNGWSFAVDVQRDGKSLWRVALGSGNLLPTAANTHDPANEIAQVRLATMCERMDVVPPGDSKRAAVAGAVAALTATVGAGKTLETHAVNVVAIHASSERIVRVPASMLPGSRIDASKTTPSSSHEGRLPPLLSVAVGLGAGHILPGPKARYPAGSLEVRLGLAFIGTGGHWLQGNVGAVLSLLEALASLASTTQKI